MLHYTIGWKRTRRLRRTRNDVIFDVFTWSFLIFIFLITAYPFYYTLITSFSDAGDLLLGSAFFWPKTFTIQNYRRLLLHHVWIDELKVSIFRTLFGSFLTVLLTSLVSYALSREKLVFGKIYRFMITFSLFVSSGIIPFYILLYYLNMINTIWVYVVPSMLNLFFAMVGINFFKTIPTSLIESARIDGAMEFTVFLKIVAPLSVPYMVTLALFSAVYQWSAWLDSAYFVSDAKLRTISFHLLQVINSMGAPQMTTQATVTVVSMLPIVCAYPFLQKFFVQGIMLGAVNE